VCSAASRAALCEQSLVVAPAMILGDVESWAIVGAIVLLILLTVQMRRYRRRLDAKRDGASESEREPEGGP
jgi:positive regulator of sigma E activity